MTEDTNRANVSAALVGCVVALFFAWGFSTVLIDTLLPKLKGLFQLNYTEAMLTQFAFFLAYFVFALPAGYLLSRLGYMRAIVVGLAIMIVGCLLFAPAASQGVYWPFLGALFVMAAGITVLQVAANPLIALLGTPKTSSSRLVLAQALNSFGTFIGPFVGASLILRNGVAVPANILKAAPDVLAAYRVQEAHVAQVPFLGIAALMTVLAVIFFLLRRAPGIPASESSLHTKSSMALLRQKRLLFGTLCIFVYVGVEVSIGGLMVSYLMQPKTLGATFLLGGALARLFTPGTQVASAVLAGWLVSFYWGGAMVGRFIGSAVLRMRRAGSVLAACAAGALMLAGLSAASTGLVSAIAIIAIGLCNSIMFPTIFTLAIDGLKENTPKASGLLCMAIVGGAIIPLITGAVADAAGLSLALAVPMLGYAAIAVYGLLTNGKFAAPAA
jgi:FHS family L-fucose permease-like MFS transporter